MLRIYTKLLKELVIQVRNWPVYFLNRFGFLKGNVQYHLRNGMTITTRPYDIDGSALNEVWFDHSYDPNAFGVPFDWAKAKNIIDVGGHIGTFTIFAAAKAPHAHIVTLEPEPGNFAVLTGNIAQNGLLPRITPHNMGLGNGQSITLFTFPGDRGGNSVFRSKENGIPVTIETMSLKDFFEKHHIDVCDYAKIDCEGAEYDALYELPAEYLARIRMIGMEYHHFSPNPEHTPDTLQAYLEKHGFTVLRHKKSMMLAFRS